MRLALIGPQTSTVVNRLNETLVCEQRGNGKDLSDVFA